MIEETEKLEEPEDTTIRMNCNHRAEVECGFLSYEGPVVYKVCDPCASMIWSKLSQPHRETYWIETLIEPVKE